jgi:Lar family restriction alleviation protein
MPKILPCPFCGNEDTGFGVHTSTLNLYIFCNCCESRGPSSNWSKGKAGTIALWNERSKEKAE